MSSGCKCGGNDVPAILPAVTEVLKGYSPNKREYLIPILQEVQEKMSYLSRDAMVQVAQHVGVPVSKVYGVATFYNQFKLSAPGKHMIQVCRGTACHVRGSEQILKSLESELGIKAGQTTKDGLISLDIVACLGSCSIAPVITIDGTFHGRLAPKDAERLAKELRATEGETK